MGLFRTGHKIEGLDRNQQLEFEVRATPRATIEYLSGYAMGYPDSIGSLGALIREYLRDYGNTFGVSATPPPGDSIFVEYLSEEAIRIRAGNRINEFWRFDISLRPTLVGTTGLAKASSNGGPVQLSTRWFGNLMDLSMGLSGAISSARG